MASVTKLLPSLGSPANIVIIPSGTRPGPEPFDRARLQVDRAGQPDPALGFLLALSPLNMTDLLRLGPLRALPDNPAPSAIAHDQQFQHRPAPRILQHKTL